MTREETKKLIDILYILHLIIKINLFHYIIMQPWPCKITFVRHGETFWNRQKIYQGQKDEAGCQLTPEGEVEATKLGQRFLAETTERNFHTIISSDLGRAHKTAALIHTEYNSKLLHTTDERLRERSFGAYEGKSRDEVDQLMNSGSTLYDGENSSQVLHRALECVYEIVTNNPGKYSSEG